MLGSTITFAEFDIQFDEDLYQIQQFDHTTCPPAITYGNDSSTFANWNCSQIATCLLVSKLSLTRAPGNLTNHLLFCYFIMITRLICDLASKSSCGSLHSNRSSSCEADVSWECPSGFCDTEIHGDWTVLENGVQQIGYAPQGEFAHYRFFYDPRDQADQVMFILFYILICFSAG